MEKRPSGITVLSATTIAAAILMIINGSILATVPAQRVSNYEFLGMQVHTPSYLAPTIIYGLGVVMFVIGISSFFVAYGLLRGISMGQSQHDDFYKYRNWNLCCNGYHVKHI